MRSRNSCVLIPLFDPACPAFCVPEKSVEVPGATRMRPARLQGTTIVNL